MHVPVATRTHAHRRTSCMTCNTVTTTVRHAFLCAGTRHPHRAWQDLGDISHDVAYIVVYCICCIDTVFTEIKGLGVAVKDTTGGGAKAKPAKKSVRFAERGAERPLPKPTEGGAATYDISDSDAA